MVLSDAYWSVIVYDRRQMGVKLYVYREGRLATAEEFKGVRLVSLSVDRVYVGRGLAHWVEAYSVPGRVSVEARGDVLVVSLGGDGGHDNPPHGEE